MKFFFLTLLFLPVGHAEVQPASGYLTEKEQPYFKNDAMDGLNKQERIDANVKELNRLNGEIAALRNELNELKGEVEKLKKKAAGN